ncbi:MAG: RHS repeat-associated core domain-containing protein [Actinomycetota bacterium]|nr:RHS repeat-associated core domain-containing protein [Actinomycetota bacterium]
MTGGVVGGAGGCGRLRDAAAGALFVAGGLLAEVAVAERGVGDLGEAVEGLGPAAGEPAVAVGVVGAGPQRAVDGDVFAAGVAAVVEFVGGGGLAAVVGEGARILDSGAVVSYTRDNTGGLVGIRSFGSPYYYLFDVLGSVVAITDATGAVTNRYSYDPFGVTTETKFGTANLFNPWRYASGYQDTSTGLYKFGARYYDPNLGRWTQTDPAGAGHPYLYAAGNPVNFVDPSGLVDVAGIDIDKFGAAVSAAFALAGILFPAYKVPAFIADSAIDVVTTLFGGGSGECKATKIAFSLVTNVVTQLGGNAIDAALETVGEKTTGALIDVIGNAAVGALGLDC